ncbi:hypothetical protein [Microbacterium elymi]|uniref:Uncharacterized protein n=1 Tax=Microbacterium elymi TaxID=2909587 RepID=A0ABY5NKM5_9MICO|nr:hypothetical protein [Microbacterium elymi]UUT35686.1 hypothetical protein L2X98_20785 [Microbacterium elymi]
MRDDDAALRFADVRGQRVGELDDAPGSRVAATGFAAVEQGENLRDGGQRSAGSVEPDRLIHGADRADERKVPGEIERGLGCAGDLVCAERRAFDVVQAERVSPHRPAGAASRGAPGRDIHSARPHAEDVDAMHRGRGEMRDSGGLDEPTHHLVDAGGMLLDRLQAVPVVGPGIRAGRDPDPLTGLDRASQGRVIDEFQGAVSAADDQQVGGGANGHVSTVPHRRGRPRLSEAIWGREHGCFRIRPSGRRRRRPGAIVFCLGGCFCSRGRFLFALSFSVCAGVLAAPLRVALSFSACAGVSFGRGC